MVALFQGEAVETVREVLDGVLVRSANVPSIDVESVSRDCGAEAGDRLR